MSKETLPVHILKDPKKLRRVIPLVLACCWLPYAIACFPGNMPWDTATSIAHWLGADRSNPNNPWFQNVMLGLVYEAGHLVGHNNLGVCVYVLIQAALEIWILTSFSVYLCERGTSPALVWIAVAVYALVPAFPLYALTMGKDSSFAVAILAFVFLAVQVAHEGQAFWREGRRRPYALVAATVAIGLFRNHAGIVPCAALLIYSLAKKDNVALRYSLQATVATLVLTVALPAVLGVPQAKPQENMSLLIQTTAYYVRAYPDELSARERDVIDAVLSFERLKDYNPDIADPIKDPASFDTYSPGEFMEVWLGLCAKHPLAMLHGAWLSMDAYLVPTRQTTVKPHTFVGYSIMERHRPALGMSNTNPLLGYAARLDALSLRIPVVSLLAKIGLYTWALVACIVYILKKREYTWLLCAAPLIMVLIGCLFSPVNGYYRYAYSMILSMPLYCVALAGARRL